MTHLGQKPLVEGHLYRGWDLEARKEVVFKFMVLTRRVTDMNKLECTLQIRQTCGKLSYVKLPNVEQIKAYIHRHYSVWDNSWP